MPPSLWQTKHCVGTKTRVRDRRARADGWPPKNMHYELPPTKHDRKHGACWVRDILNMSTLKGKFTPTRPRRKALEQNGALQKTSTVESYRTMNCIIMHMLWTQFSRSFQQSHIRKCV